MTRTVHLYADDGGTGDMLPVVFLHSTAGNASQWAAQLEHLRPTRRAVALEWRGHGRSAAPDDGDYSFPATAADVEEAVNRLSIGRFVLLGHSGGGLVAVQYRSPTTLTRARVWTASSWAKGRRASYSPTRPTPTSATSCPSRQAWPDRGALIYDYSYKPDAPKLVEASPSKDKRAVLFGGPDHGIDLLEGKHGPRARSLLEGFVERNLG